MKTFTLLIALMLLAAQQLKAAENLYKDYPNDITPELSNAGAYTVGVTTLSITYPEPTMTLTGQIEQRKLTLEVWYPAEAEGELAVYDNETRSGIPFSIQGSAYRDSEVAVSEAKFPVIVLSHGYTGYRTIMYYLGEHLASHGYIVAGIDHTDSTNIDVDLINAPFAGFPSTLLNRSRDQVLTLSAIIEHDKFKQASDPNNAGLIGYSMGGYGAVNTVGGCFAFSDQAVGAFTGIEDVPTIQGIKGLLNTCAGGNPDTSAVDPRWKAMMALAPWGGQHRVFSEDALNQVKVPVLYVAGDHDDVSGYEGMRWLFDSTGNKDSKLLTFINARHNIAPHPAPSAAFGNELDIGHYIEPAWRSQSMNAINEHFALALMNCHVKAQTDFCDYLNVEGNSNQAPVNGEVPTPWKGFDHRYASGLKMESKP